MRVEIVNTGSEILLGQVTNTHLGFLAQSLFELGLRVQRQVTVPDGVAIAEAVAESLARADLIIITGGLGPTSDDVTREAVAEAFGRPLIFHPEILDGIARRFAERGLKMNELQRQQAMVPEGGVVLENRHGTAPGLIVRHQHAIAVILPGPPGELRPMWDEAALPWLRENLPPRAPLFERDFRLIGVGETRVQLELEEKLRALGRLEIGYCPRPGEVDLRVIAEDAATADRAAALVRERFAPAIYAEGRESMEEVVVRIARERGRKIATAESCTGGLIAHRLTNVPGSSEVFLGGWVTYANAVKTAELGVPEEILAKHGAVSAQVAGMMARGALVDGADLAVAVTGIAGPGGGSPEKPVGLVYFGLAMRDGSLETFEARLSRTREMFKNMASQLALDFLRRALLR
jgi:nicotinamide-nucleotide amidase